MTGQKESNWAREARVRKDDYYQRIQQIHVRGEERKVFNRYADQVQPQPNPSQVVKELIDNEPNENYYRQKYEMEVVEPERRRREMILMNKKKNFKPIRKDELVLRSLKK